MPAPQETQRRQLARAQAFPMDFLKKHGLMLVVGGVAAAALIIAILNMIKLNQHPALQKPAAQTGGGSGGYSGGCLG